MGTFHQDPYVIVNLTVPVIAVAVICIARLWILIVRYRGIQRLLKWQKILSKQSGKPPSLASTPERTIASFMGNLMPDILKIQYSFSLNFRSKLRQYHPFFGFILDSAEGMRLTMLLWGQILFVFVFGMIFVDILFHRFSFYSQCQLRTTRDSCEWNNSRGGIRDWMTLCEWSEDDGQCLHAFYFNQRNETVKQQAMIIVVIISFGVTALSIFCTQMILQHPIRCITMAYHINFVTTSEKSLEESSPSTTMLSSPVINTDLRMKPSIVDFNDELRGACGDKRPVLEPLQIKQRRLLKLNQVNTLLPLPLGQARQRIFLLAARHRQLLEKYDDLPTGKILTGLLLSPPTVTPFPQRPLSQVSDSQHCWNSMLTNGQVFLFQYYLQQSAFNPRALQALFETCRHYYTETIYSKLRCAQDISQDLHYLCQHLPAPYSPEATMVSNTSSLVKLSQGNTFDRDLYLMKMFLTLWMPGIQSMLLFQVALEEETEMLYYVDDTLRSTLAFERMWQKFLLKPLLFVYRACLRPDNAELTKQEASRAAFRTTRIQYLTLLLLLYFLVLPGGLFYYFYWMTDANSTRYSKYHIAEQHRDDTRASILFLWQCVCLVSIVQYYFIIVPLRILIVEIIVPRIWLAVDFRELHHVLSARIPYILRRRSLIVLDVVVPNKPRFLPNQGPIREIGSYLQAFHPICRVCRQTEILRSFPIAHFFLSLTDRDITLPSHFRPIIEIIDRKQQKNAPKHVELKRLENSTRVIEDLLTRQSVLVYDFLTMVYRDVTAVLYLVGSFCRYLLVLVFEMLLQRLCLFFSERQVRIGVYDLLVTVFVFGYLQWAVLAFILHFPSLWILGLIWVYAPIWGVLLFGVIIPKIYSVVYNFWNQGYDDMLTAQDRARQRHRAQLRKAHEKESRMIGIDLLGDMPEIVDVTEQELAEEEYLRDKAKRLGKPLYAVRKKPKAFVFTKKIKYENRGAQAELERAEKWRRGWERGHINRLLGLVGLNVFWFMPFAKYGAIKSSKIAVAPGKKTMPSNSIPRVNLTRTDDDEEGGMAYNQHDGEYKRGYNTSAPTKAAETKYHPPDYEGDFSDIDDDSMA